MSLPGRVKRLEVGQRILAKEVKGIHGQVQTLEARVNELDGLMTRLSGAVGAHEGRLGSLEEGTDSLQIELDQTQLEVTTDNRAYINSGTIGEVSMREHRLRVRVDQIEVKLKRIVRALKGDD